MNRMYTTSKQIKRVFYLIYSSKDSALSFKKIRSGIQVAESVFFLSHRQAALDSNFTQKQKSELKTILQMPDKLNLQAHSFNFTSHSTINHKTKLFNIYSSSVVFT